MSKPDATPAKWENENGLVAARLPDGSASLDEAYRIAARMVAAVNAYDTALKLADAVLAYNKPPFEMRWKYVEQLARQVKEAVK